MSFIKLEEILPKSIKKAGIKKQVESAKILEEFNEVASRVFGPRVMKKIKPLYLRNGNLTITCLSSVLAEKLKAKEEKVLQELNRPYKKRIVERLRFLV
jgi:predicted nucleic acid-binding Zn ribbon protein